MAAASRAGVQTKEPGGSSTFSGTLRQKFLELPLTDAVLRVQPRVTEPRPYRSAEFARRRGNPNSRSHKRRRLESKLPSRLRMDRMSEHVGKSLQRLRGALHPAADNKFRARPSSARTTPRSARAADNPLFHGLKNIERGGVLCDPEQCSAGIFIPPSVRALQSKGEGIQPWNGSRPPGKRRFDRLVVGQSQLADTPCTKIPALLTAPPPDNVGRQRDSRTDRVEPAPRALRA